MKGSSLVSRPGSLVCPMCEVGRVRSTPPDPVRCDACCDSPSGAIVEALRQITTLADALAGHACECGHPEMRFLPDGTFHCPACGSEVLPIDAPSTFSKPGEPGEAYWLGWLDGRYGKIGSFVDNPNLARWDDPSSRLDYYRGHRAGSEMRQVGSARRSRAHHGFSG